MSMRWSLSQQRGSSDNRGEQRETPGQTENDGTDRKCEESGDISRPIRPCCCLHNGKCTVRGAECASDPTRTYQSV